jgi:hypothetical protein
MAENTAGVNIVLSGEDFTKFKQAIKVGFYKDFLKNGIITAQQFEKLMQLQK